MVPWGSHRSYIPGNLSTIFTPHKRYIALHAAFMMGPSAHLGKLAHYERCNYLRKRRFLLPLRSISPPRREMEIIPVFNPLILSPLLFHVPLLDLGYHRQQSASTPLLRLGRLALVLNSLWRKVRQAVYTTTLSIGIRCSLTSLLLLNIPLCFRPRQASTHSSEYRLQPHLFLLSSSVTK